MARSHTRKNGSKVGERVAWFLTNLLQFDANDGTTPVVFATTGKLERVKIFLHGRSRR
jgi:hypothetical protein